MKIAACILAIISGLIGLFGSKLNSILGFGSFVLINKSNTHLLTSGTLMVIFASAVILLGLLILKFPKTAGLLLMGVAIVAFFHGNVLSAPFAFLSGMLGLFSPSADPKYNSGGWRIGYAATYLVVLVAGYGANAFILYQMNKEPEKVENTQGIAITADALAKEYNADEKAADAKYLNKTLEVSGTVSEVDKNQDGGTMIVLQTADPAAGIQCTMRDKGINATKGQNIAIKGFCSGNGITGVSITDCVLK
jgi:hypothetical protein